MKCISLLVSLLAIPALANADTLTPSRTTAVSRDYSNPIDITTHSLAQSPAIPLTNGQRLSLGLPPKPPRRLHVVGRAALQPRQSSTCQPLQAYIEVSVDSPNSIPRYLSRSPNSFGEYQPTGDPTEAMQVSVCAESVTTSDTFDIIPSNALKDYPCLGGVVGFASTSSNIGPGSYNYAYIVGTSQIPRGPAAVAPNSFSAASGIPEGTESNIWRFGSNGQHTLLPSWVNGDGSLAATQLMYVPSSNAFAILGDSGAFRAKFGDAWPATFTFVQGAPVPPA